MYISVEFQIQKDTCLYMYIICIIYTYKYQLKNFNLILQMYKKYDD